MIRVDEIYNNVFLPLVQDRKGIGLHWFDPFGSVDIKDMISLPSINNVATHRFLFWDQEPVYQDTFSRFMEGFRQLYMGPLTLVTSEQHSEATTWTQDTYGLDLGYYFFHGWAALDWYRGYNHSFLWQAWPVRQLEHKIFCPNNIISGRRNHRVLLVSGMNQRNLLAGNVISFPDRCPFSKTVADDICHDLGIPTIEGLPLQIDVSDNHAQNSHRIDFHSHATKCFCHVVTETLYEGQRWHLTEKTFKPIVLQQPFVLVAPRGSLAYLRSYGFQSFDSIWDESYDSCQDNFRIDAVLDLLDQINRWTPQQIRDAQVAIHRVVQHNHDWFYGGFQDLLWQELSEMVKQW